MSGSDVGGSGRFECENGHGFDAPHARRCPYCETGYVYLITEVEDRVPV